MDLPKTDNAPEGGVTGVAGTTAILVGLLGVAVLVALVAERLRVPGAVALVAFGAGTASIYPIALPFHFGDTLLFIFLPPLIFEAAWSIDPAALRRSAGRIALLALPGVVLVAGTIGFGIALTGQLPLAPAIVLGAIVSATDPVAVIAIFRRLDVPIDLLTLVEGESIANDGVAIVLYGIALTFAIGRRRGFGARRIAARAPVDRRRLRDRRRVRVRRRVRHGPNALAAARDHARRSCSLFWPI